MNKVDLDRATLDRLLTAQTNEITEHFIYERLSASEKDKHNKRILSEISKDELKHYRVWKAYTGRDVEPNRYKVGLYVFLSRIFGITFSIKLMEKGEGQAQVNYLDIARIVPAARAISRDEDRHEDELIALIDEDRLKYIGAVIRGLNEALIELSAVLSGLTLALHDSRFIALTGIITGVAMSFSLGASEYLAGKTESHVSPVKAAAYTAGANLVTAVFLIFPYFVFENYYAALGLMLFNAALVILIFNYHISVARDLNFKRSFAEMFAIFAGVSALTFLIGYLARVALHIDLH
jgi:VIT1/CCC1 family predicted Fe2+/Mn2+ transporter